MPNSSAGGTRGRKRAPRTWHDLAAATAKKRDLWLQTGSRVLNHTEFVACGLDWDAVAVRPIQLGLDALVAMQLGTRRGYRVLADHLRDELYVLVPVGNADDFTGLPGVRVLSRGHQLLMPRTPEHTSQVADWVGTPGETLALVDPQRLAARLQDLAPALYESVAP
ncbi:hypothetical protein AB0D74_49070 [Streptomyces sp. NPDC048278]|uniref:hypothetical protein n=1 Tax=Streptomyces sp. NPDC048278 TaxID=3155809 RepID=UPI00341BC015